MFTPTPNGQKTRQQNNHDNLIVLIDSVQPVILGLYAFLVDLFGQLLPLCAPPYPGMSTCCEKGDIFFDRG